MGFFDNLIKNVVGDTLGKKVEEHIGNDSDKKVENTTVPSVQGRHDKPFFADILASEFSEYEVKENVPVSELGGEGKPYEFGLYKNGKLVAVIPLVEHNRVNNKAYKDSKEAAAKANVPFINFHLHMPNERDFVIYRINRFIAK